MVCDFVTMCEIYSCLFGNKDKRNGKKEGKKMLRSLWKRVLCCAVRIILGRIALH